MTIKMRDFLTGVDTRSRANLIFPSSVLFYIFFFYWWCPGHLCTSRKPVASLSNPQAQAVMLILPTKVGAEGLHLFFFWERENRDLHQVFVVGFRPRISKLLLSSLNHSGHPIGDLLLYSMRLNISINPC